MMRRDVDVIRSRSRFPWPSGTRDSTTSESPTIRKNSAENLTCSGICTGNYIYLPGHVTKYLRCTGTPVLIALMAGDAAHNAELLSDEEQVSRVMTILKNVENIFISFLILTALRFDSRAY